MRPRKKLEPEAGESALRDGPAAGQSAVVAGAPMLDDVLTLQRSAGNHVVARLMQQANGRMLARDTWAKEYRTRKSRQNLSYEDYKAKIGQAGAERFAPALKSASEWGGTRISPVALTREELGNIVVSESKADAEVAAHEKRLDDYLKYINDAFETMGLDTVEAQSAFLAHAAESGSFAAMTEKGASKRPYAPFIGRGPIQVTHEAGYVQTLAYVEARGEQLEAQAASEEQTAPGSDKAKRLRELAAMAKEAVAAIKADITKAADPKYAFMFSSGFMHMSRGVKRSAELEGKASPAFAGHGAEDQWVTGFTESFQQTLDKAPERKAAAQERLRAAQAELATTPAEPAEARKAVEKKVKAAQNDIARQEGAIRDMPSALRGAKIKKGIYERAHSELSKKALPAGASAPGASAPGAQPQEDAAATAPPGETGAATQTAQAGAAPDGRAPGAAAPAHVEKLQRIANRALGERPGFASGAHQLIWELVHVYAPDKAGQLGGSEYKPGMDGFKLGPKATLMMGHDVVHRVADGELEPVAADLRAVLGARAG